MNKFGEFFKPKSSRDMRILVQLNGFILSDKGDHFAIYFRGNQLKVFKGKTKEDGTLKGVRCAYFLNKTPIHRRIKYHKHPKENKRRLQSLMEYF